jgi:hypothetical protein
MPKEGPAFYDDEAVFKTYLEGRRSRSDIPIDTLEKPVILELAGDLANQRILDLGCGDAAFGLYALSQGCQTYVGVEGSHKMATATQQQLAGTSGTDECPAEAIAFQLRRNGEITLGVEAADRADKASLKRRQISPLDITIAVIWIGITLFFTLSARQGVSQEIKVTMSAGLLLIIYGVVRIAQKSLLTLARYRKMGTE